MTMNKLIQSLEIPIDEQSFVLRELGLRYLTLHKVWIPCTVFIWLNNDVLCLSRPGWLESGSIAFFPVFKIHYECTICHRFRHCFHVSQFTGPHNLDSINCRAFSLSAWRFFSVNEIYFQIYIGWPFFILNCSFVWCSFLHTTWTISSVTSFILIIIRAVALVMVHTVCKCMSSENQVG